MLDKVKQAYQLKKAQSDLQKLVESLSVFEQKGDNSVVITGDKKITKIVINGVENKALKDLINDAMKKMDTKLQKEMKAKEDEIRSLLGM
jgi:DNA-binding protein YbaB